MVRITDDPVACADAFAAAGVAVPGYDLSTASPRARWIHLGAGNFFRALHAEVAQRLLASGALDAGLVVADIVRDVSVKRVYRPYGNRHLLVVMRPDGGTSRELITCVAQSLFAGDDADWRRLCEAAADPALQLVTVTVTEKGHALTGPDGDWLPQVAADLEAGPGRPRAAMGVVTGMLWARFQAGGTPLAVVSTDNFSGNGDKLRDAVHTFASALAERGRVGADFLAWLHDPARVSFPCTMVDRITPNPAPALAEELTAAGVADVELVRTSPSTTMSCFANAEPAWYLVVEDDFPNGRPPLEQAGVLLAGREAVNLADEMKVTACLNPLHTALAVFGRLLGYDRIWQELRDDDLRALVEGLGYREALPVVASPGIIDPAAFLDEVLRERLPNVGLPDSPERIAADTSQKIPIRFGVTLRKYLDRPGADLSGLRLIPLTLAAWVRYLMGVDDRGEPMTLSPDPMLDELRPQLAGLALGADNAEAASRVPALLARVVGVDLSGLARTIVADVVAMTAGPGAVRARLHEVVSQQGGKR